MQTFLFSYGTLQLERVQLTHFGKKLVGQPDTLLGYKLERMKIKNEGALKTSGIIYHPIAVATGNDTDKIKGVIFEISENYLKITDEYEVDEYERTWEKLQSGKSAWVYVQPQNKEHSV